MICPMKIHMFLRKSISFKKLLITISLTTTLFLLLVVSTVLYNNTSSYITQKMDAIDTNKLNQIVSGIDSRITQINNISTYLQNNKQLIDLINRLESPDTSMYEKGRIYMDIQLFLSNIMQYNSMIRSINIITESSQYDSGGVILSSSLIDNIDKSVSRDINFRYPSNNLKSFPDYNIIETLDTCTYFNFSLYDSNGCYGQAFIILKYNYITGCTDNVDNILILDGTMNEVFKGKMFDDIHMDSLLQSISDNGSNKVIASYKQNKVYRKDLSSYGWSVLYLSEIDKYTNKYTTLRILVAACFLICTVVSFAVSGIISKKVLKPMVWLSSTIKKYKVDSYDHDSIDEENSKSTFSLREKIFYYLIITILLPVTSFVAIFYFKSNIIMREELSQSYMTVFEKKVDYLTDYMQKKQIILQGIAYDSSVQNYITRYPKPDANLVYDMIEQNIYLGLDRDAVSIYDSSNNLLITNQFRLKENMDSSFYEKLEKSFREMVWDIYTDKLNRTVVSLGMPIVPLYDKNRSGTIGYAKVDIDYTYISELFSELKNENSDIFIADKNGNNIENSKKMIAVDSSSSIFENSSGRKNINISDKKYMIFYKSIDGSPWYLVSQKSYYDFMEESSAVFTDNMYLFIIILLFVTVLSYYISTNLLKPVSRLKRLFKKLSTGNFDEKMSENYYIDEINDLVVSFNRMTDRIEDLIDELIITNAEKTKLEYSKKNAEIVALQAQINPHFLYNTLNTIIYMIKDDFKDNAILMVKNLSSLFRYGISRGEIIINIGEEIEYAKAYVNIIKLRYTNKISFEWNIDTALIRCKTIKLILQPIIENAIYHGIRKDRGMGTIEISCLDCGNSVNFIIKDNGVGIHRDELESLKYNLSTNSLTDTIGIYNVQARIRLHYGEKYGISIDSTYGEGTTITLSIPKKTDVVK